MLLGASRKKSLLYRSQRILTVLKLRPYPDQKTIVASGLTETSTVPHWSSSLLKNPTYSDAEERKESESVASGINHSPPPSSANQSCVAVGSENFFPQTARSTKCWRQKPVGVRAVELDPPRRLLASFNAVVALARQRTPGRQWRDVASAACPTCWR